MKLLLDRAGIDVLLYHAASTEHGDSRTYYTGAAPLRAIVVCRNGLDVHTATGQVADAAIGSERGWAGFVRAGNEGTLHTKITIYRLLPSSRPERRLSAILRSGYRDRQGA